MSIFLPTHMEILPPAQRLVWPDLAAAHRLGFVLYGGTAIALRLGHRSSVDFDFFTADPLKKNLSVKNYIHDAVLGGLRVFERAPASNIIHH
jgi:hypothetical protein